MGCCLIGGVDFVVVCWYDVFWFWNCCGIFVYLKVYSCVNCWLCCVGLSWFFLVCWVLYSYVVVRWYVVWSYVCYGMKKLLCLVRVIGLVERKCWCWCGLVCFVWLLVWFMFYWFVSYVFGLWVGYLIICLNVVCLK